MSVAGFYLGTDAPVWLARMDEPLFVSRRALAPRKSFPRALGRWALDSGGFTEIALNERWTVPASEYVADVRRFADEIGNMDWAAPQDWMCEPTMLAKTRLTVRQHQALTIANLLDLRALAADLPIIPVVQGWERDDYLRCVDSYDRAGVDLTREDRVGIGSVCRRHRDDEIAAVVNSIASLGIRLHAFGVRGRAFQRLCGVLRSADSMAWSYNARRNPPMPGCAHQRCNHCPRFARAWRSRVLRGAQPSLFDQYGVQDR